MRGATSGRLLRQISASRAAVTVPRSRSLGDASNNICLLCQHRSGNVRAMRQQARPEQIGRRFASTSKDSAATPASESNADGAENSDSVAGIMGVSPDVSNYYSIFPKTLPNGQPPNSPFDISVADLRREFLALQNQIHPDKHAPGHAKERAEALSSRINEAYRTLADPLARAQYILAHWHGIDVTAEDGSSQHALDPEMLMEVMDVQETIEDVGADPQAEAEIKRLKGENDARVAESVKALGQAFDQGDIEAARKECIRLRFWYSLAQALRDWEPGTTELRIVH
ncbi:DnaJ domain protein [Paecilomyces variotii No. 5]|uniref:DnaJ domain protein n=1 Tax=Byssochlamys spectabilis (strain No. 5 / NBRC 109023) TaxID=1356009 RepID=V5FYH9_BYSSN|nr:DnaJ domain protein [Paecilomyces variotii No. 5]